MNKKGALRRKLETFRLAVNFLSSARLRSDAHYREGIFGPPKDRQGALAVLRRAVELGVRFIDTADLYGPDVSEELISEALFPYPKDLVVATKGGWLRPGPNQRTHDASPASSQSDRRQPQETALGSH